MSHPKKTHEPIRQNEVNVKKSQKHETNLRKNSSLYFQMGLIICLITAYGLLEMKFETTIPKTALLNLPDDASENFVPEFKVEVATVHKPIKPIMTEPTSTFIEVPDTRPDILIDAPTNPTGNTSTTLNPSDLNNLVEKPKDIEDVPFENLEFVPVYPGCENKKTNQDKRKCMSDKINQLVQKKFNTNLGGDLGLQGKQVIRTQFKIDKTGRVSDIQVRATHPDLEKEAKRVINFIPEMKPGKQRDVNVGVIYTLPIVFEVQD